MAKKERNGQQLPHDLVKRNVQVLLARRGLSLKAVCTAKGVSYKLAHMWIYHDMRLSSLFNLAHVLDVMPWDLIQFQPGEFPFELTCPMLQNEASLELTDLEESSSEVILPDESGEAELASL
jgi:DNA-binding Xre family transcriptional regulator